MSDKTNTSLWKGELGIFLKLALITVLFLLCLIPAMMVSDLGAARRSLRDSTIAEVSQGWGGSQMIPGPYIRVPILKARVSGEVEIIERTWHYFLPSSMDVDGSIETQLRTKGIFTVPLYRLSGEMEGDFALVPGEDRLEGQALWDESELVWEVPGFAGFAHLPKLILDGEEVPWKQGVGTLGLAQTALVYQGSNLLESQFQIDFDIKGAQSLSFLPFGEENTLDLQGDWASPGFSGRFLPAQNQYGPEGFQASWSILGLGRNFPSRFSQSDSGGMYFASSGYGVNLYSPIDQYQLLDRATKYGFLFVFLPFLVLFLFEVLAKKSLHPIQYFFVGVANALFFLLLLSLSEHLHFGLSFALAALLPTFLVSLYLFLIMDKDLKALLLSAVMAFAYGFLFVVLQSEDYALLWGSLGIFLVLGLVMFLTIRVDWNGIGKKSSPKEEAPET